MIPIENTSYLLVEFDVRKELGKEYEVEDYLYEIEIKGYKPIIAHAERYFLMVLIYNVLNNGLIMVMSSKSMLQVY